MGVKIILKNGQEIVNTSPNVTVKKVREAFSLTHGATITFGEDGESGFILCSEIAAVFGNDDPNKSKT